MTNTRTGPIPRYSLELTARTDQREDPTHAVQYAVLDRGEHHTYGDQSWVAYGRALTDAHPHGRVQRRTVTITYGQWEDVGDPRRVPGAATERGTVVVRDTPVQAMRDDLDRIAGKLASIHPTDRSEAQIIAAIGELLLVVARLLPEEA